MKRLFPTALALLLMLSSLGHVLAAAFCPHAGGRDCCLTTFIHQHSAPSIHENAGCNHGDAHGMSMAGMDEDAAAGVAGSIDDPSLNDAIGNEATVVKSDSLPSIALGEELAANKFDQPVGSCACVAHSDLLNAPVSFVGAANQSGKEIRSVLLPVSMFGLRPTIAATQIGLPGEHAPPPDIGVPRHIFISVFLL